MSNLESVIPSGGDWVSSGMNYKEFRNAGHAFAIRYAVPSIAGKMVTRGEIALAHDAGIDICLVYEVNGTSWEGGQRNGAIDGHQARLALESLGAPETVACYHAVDSQVSEGQINTCMEWLRAVRDNMVPFRTGVYGQYSVIEAAYTLDSSIYRWQTQAWSSARVSQHVDILQLGSQSFDGINIDLDVAYTNRIGQWYANPNSQPIPASEDHMITGQVAPLETVSIPVPPLSPTYIMLMCDVGLFAGAAQKVRVAVRSKAKGWSQIIDQALTTADSTTITFKETDVDAVSLSRSPEDGAAPVGFAIV